MDLLSTPLLFLVALDAIVVNFLTTEALGPLISKAGSPATHFTGGRLLPPTQPAHKHSHVRTSPVALIYIRTFARR